MAVAFKRGDRVRFKPDLMSGVHRRGQIGTVTAVHNPPAQGGPIVDIQFNDDTIERGISVSQIEHE